MIIATFAQANRAEGTIHNEPMYEDVAGHLLIPLLHKKMLPIVIHKHQKLVSKHR